MAVAAFKRLHDRLLAHLGEEAILRGVTPCKVNVIRDEQVTQGDVTFERTTVTLLNILTPVPGDTVDLIDTDGTVLESFVLEGPMLTTNGIISKFVVRED